MNNVVSMINAKKVEIGGLELNLRLDGRAVLTIEKRLNKSLMGMFLASDGGFKLPPTTEMLIVIQGANKKSGITEKMLVEAFYDHLDNGGTTMEVQNIVQELLDESGFFGNKKEAEKTNGESVEEEIILDGEIIPEADSPL